jgi:hypothetical protein
MNTIALHNHIKTQNNAAIIPAHNNNILYGGAVIPAKKPNTIMGSSPTASDGGADKKNDGDMSASIQAIIFDQRPMSKFTTSRKLPQPVRAPVRALAHGRPRNVPSGAPI